MPNKRATIPDGADAGCEPRSRNRNLPIKILRRAAAAIVLSAAGAIGIVASSAGAAEAPVSFSEDVAPIFVGRCVACHQPGGEGHAKSGLDLTTYEGLMKGTKYGPMVIPGDPERSNLIWLLDWRAGPELRMPHGKKKLSSCDRNAIRHWIQQGAKNN